jgi:hypothetical protein
VFRDTQFNRLIVRGVKMKWLEPWWSTAEQSNEFHQTFQRQLKKELSPAHELYGIPVKLIGRRGDNDDPLFEFSDGSGKAQWCT